MEGTIRLKLTGAHNSIVQEGRRAAETFPLVCCARARRRVREIGVWLRHQMNYSYHSCFLTI